MKMLTDEQIFDILDGVASAETQQKHAYLLANSPEYKANFQEIEILHLDLVEMPIEQTSTQFTENVLANIQFENQTVKKKSWSSQLTWIFLTLMLVFFVATISLTLFYFSNSNSAIEIPRINHLEVVNNFPTDILVKVLLLINLIVLLAIFDKKVLKPYFLNRKMRLS